MVLVRVIEAAVLWGLCQLNKWKFSVLVHVCNIYCIYVGAISSFLYGVNEFQCQDQINFCLKWYEIDEWYLMWYNFVVLRCVEMRVCFIYFVIGYYYLRRLGYFVVVKTWEN